MLMALFWKLRDLFPKFRNKIKRSLLGIPVFNEQDGSSDSQITFYVGDLRKLRNNEKLLSRFRRRYDYREILEHVSFKQGRSYIERIEKLHGKDAEALIQRNKGNDLYGNPITFKYGKLGRLSPTTLRYIATALEIDAQIGISSHDKVAEIGVGYGGQAAVISRTFDIESYTMFDLPEVFSLTARYLVGIQSDLKPSYCTLKDDFGFFDLAISNYAFSELSRDLQESYLEKVLLRSKKGYMIMNTGRSNFTGRSNGKLTMLDLLSRIPNAQMKEEVPKTGPDNYVIFWN